MGLRRGFPGLTPHDVGQFFSHLLNFFMPALAMAVLVPAVARLVWWRTLQSAGWWRQVRWCALLNVTVLVAGLLVMGRDGAKIKSLWQKVDQGGEFDIAETALLNMERTFAFVSGSSNHANRVATIRDIHQRYGVVIDTHTADGIKVGLEHREAGVPLICLETAQAVKFADVIRDVLGREPECPSSCRDLESLPLRVEVMNADTAAVKRYIAERA